MEEKKNTADTIDIVNNDAKESEVTLANSRGLQLQNLADLWQFSTIVSRSGLAPKGMEKTDSIFVAVQMGLELGLTPMQALQNIASINGRPSVWGDAVPGLVRSSGLLEYYKEEETGKYPNDNYGWIITSKRVGDPEPISTTFTIEDAKKAGLFTKSGPWTTHPKRMLKMRARTFNFRDNFPDVLKGLYTVEEAREIKDAEYTVEGDDGKSKTEKLAEKLTDTEPPETKDEREAPFLDLK